MTETTIEQRARAMLERIGVSDAGRFTAGDLVELANLICNSPREPDLVMTVQPDMGVDIRALECGVTFKPGDVFDMFRRKT